MTLIKKCQGKIALKFTLFCSAIYASVLGCAGAEDVPSRPNIVFIFADDQGYADLGVYGSETIRTPHIDRMAAEGRMFTSFYMASSICTPSRAGLLTGAYPSRIGMGGGVVFPGHRHGLHPDEETLGDLFKRAGYATACIGKWHLGHAKGLLPTDQGFDTYYGIPYSNDMIHPDDRGKPFGQWDASWKDQDMEEVVWHTPLMRDEEIIELPVNQRTITRRYTDEAIRFMEENKEKPFFVYLAHTMPHVPLYVPEEWYDPDTKHAYTRMIEHMDAETGRILDAVRELGLVEKTYVIYTSDNGPWLNLRNDPHNHHTGSAKPFRDGKFSTYEGGHRVPFVIWGPGVPAGTKSDAFLTSLEIFPTFAAMVGVEPNPRGPIDGYEAGDTLIGDAPSPREEFLYYESNGSVQALRQKDWKVRDAGGEPELYNLAEDLGEQNNLAKEWPKRVEALMGRMRELDQDIQENQRSRGEGGELPTSKLNAR